MKKIFLLPFLLILSSFGIVQAQVTHGDTICAGDTTFVYANANPSVTYEWYDAIGGNLLGTGDTLWTGTLTNTTDYYLKIISAGGAAYTVGPQDNTIAGGSNYTYYPDGLVFDVITNVTIDSVFVYPNGPGNVVINILDASNATIHTVTVPVTTTGKTQIPINYSIAPGTGYKMNAVGTTTGGLFRNTGGANYPYNSTPLNITGAINGSSTFYYKFYDWHLSTGPAPVWDSAKVVVNSLPIANLGNDTTFCDGGSLSYVEPANESYSWSTGQTGSLVIDTSGFYTLTVIDTNGCVAMDDIDVTVEYAPTALAQVDTTNCPMVSFTDQSTDNPDAWLWSFGDGNSSTSPNSSNSYASGGTYNASLIASNACGADTTNFTVDINCIAGIGNAAQDDAHVSIYPNPGNGQFTVTSSLEGKVNIEVYTVSGHLVMTKNYISAVNAPQVIELDNLESGAYILKITNGDKVLTRPYLLK